MQAPSGVGGGVIQRQIEGVPASVFDGGDALSVGVEDVQFARQRGADLQIAIPVVREVAVRGRADREGSGALLKVHIRLDEAVTVFDDGSGSAVVRSGDAVETNAGFAPVLRGSREFARGAVLVAISVLELAVLHEIKGDVFADSRQILTDVDAVDFRFEGDVTEVRGGFPRAGDFHGDVRVGNRGTIGLHLEVKGDPRPFFEGGKFHAARVESVDVFGKGSVLGDVERVAILQAAFGVAVEGNGLDFRREQHVEFDVAVAFFEEARAGFDAVEGDFGFSFAGDFVSAAAGAGSEALDLGRGIRGNGLLSSVA